MVPRQKDLKGRLIGGWQMSAIYAINSGLPLTISASSGLLAHVQFAGSRAKHLQRSGQQRNETDNAGISVLGNTNAGLRPNQIGNPNNGYGAKFTKGR